MMNLKNYTVKEFANEINENVDTMMELMQKSRTISYTNKPLENVVKMVNKSNIKEANKDIVTKFVYFNLYNR